MTRDLRRSSGCIVSTTEGGSAAGELSAGSFVGHRAGGRVSRFGAPEHV